MKTLLLMYILLMGPQLLAQGDYEKSIITWQNEMNAALQDPEASPLSKKEIKNFKAQTFFPISTDFRIEATFEKIMDFSPIYLPTTSDRKLVLLRFGKAHFTVNGTKYTLTIYQDYQQAQTNPGADYLFLPFTDLTSGRSTYGAGRYLDLKVSEISETMIIDFNKAYNPSCAYNEAYSCPIPPQENNLNLAVEAGMKAWEKHY